MPIHVVQLGPFPPPEGGISRNMLAIRETLREQGNRCSIIATSRSTHITDEPDVYHPGTAIRLISQLRRMDFEVLHLHIGGEISRRVLSLAFACTVAAKGRSVLTVHSGGYPQTEAAKRATRSSLAGIVFRRFSHLIAVNQEIANVFARYGVPEETISVIMPYSLSVPDPGVPIPDELASFMDEHSPLLLSVGGLERDYDPLFQIAAMKQILADAPGAGLLLVGDGSMTSEVEKAIAASGFGGAVYLAGNVEHAVTLHLIDRATALLRTTLFDADAISVREALYLGTPVIATDTGNRPAGVHLIPIGDTASLRNAVQDLPEKTQKLDVRKPDNSNIDAVTGLYREIARSNQR